MSNDRNPNEFVRLLVEHQFRLYSYILSLVPNYSDADDVMQETSVALWEMFDQYQLGTDFAAWACSVARYRVLKYRDRKGRVPLLMDEEVLESVSQAAISQADDLDTRRQALQTCIRELSERDRELLEQTYDPTNRTLKQVAEVLGRPANTVYKAASRIHRALLNCVKSKLRIDSHG